MKFVHLPSHERIVVRVRGSSDETPPPINPRTESVEIFLSDRREVFQPVVGIGELFDLFSGNTYTRERGKLARCCETREEKRSVPIDSMIWNWY